MLSLILSAIIQGMSAYAFSQSLGVNMHVDRPDGQWQNRPFLTAFLKAEGFKYIRSPLVILSNPTYSAYLQQLDDQDRPDAIRSDQIVGPGLSCANIVSLMRVWGVIYFEGPNEATPADTNTQVAATSGCTQWKSIPQIAPTTLNTDPAQIASSAYAFGNMHDYTQPFPPETAGWGGPVYGQIYGSEAYNIAAANRAAPGKPVISTEYGYDSSVVSESTQASYDERMTLVHAANGIQKQFLYDLVDDNQSYGLARLDGSMKPAAFGMQGLMAILWDSAPFTGQCTLDATITAPAGVTVNAYLFCKSNGEKDLVLVQPAQLQDPATLVSTPAIQATVKVTFSPMELPRRLYTQTPGYQWLHNDSPSFTNGAYNVNVTERPLILATNTGPAMTIPMLPSP